MPRRFEADASPLDIGVRGSALELEAPVRAAYARTLICCPGRIWLRAPIEFQLRSCETLTS